MKRIYLMLFVMMLAISCRHQAVRDKTNYDLDTMRLFTTQKLQDTLISFINSVDLLDYSGDMKMEYMVRCSIDKNDTILCIYAALDFLPAKESLPGQENDIIIGGLIYNEKPIIVRYYGIDSLRVIDHDVLDINIAKQIDSLKKREDGCEYVDSPYHFKMYRYIYPDSLLLLNVFNRF